MPRKSNNVAVLTRRQQIADLTLQGWSQTQIAAELGVSQATVSHDLKIIRQNWRDSAVRDFDSARALELQKIDLIERESWSAWRRSQQPQTSATVTEESPGEKPGAKAAEKTKKSVANRYGDPRFLEQINKCITQRRALLGLDVTMFDNQETSDGNLSLEARRQRVEELLAAIGQRVGAAATGAGTLDGQPRRLCDGHQSGQVETGAPPRLPESGPDDLP